MSDGHHEAGSAGTGEQSAPSETEVGLNSIPKTTLKVAGFVLFLFLSLGMAGGREGSGESGDSGHHISDGGGHSDGGGGGGAPTHVDHPPKEHAEHPKEPEHVGTEPAHGTPEPAHGTPAPADSHGSGH